MRSAIFGATVAALSAGVGVSAQTTQGFYVASNYIIASSPSTNPVNLTINTQDKSLQNDTAPMLYGLMFEDINHSGDGGIYAEALINRDFQGEHSVYLRLVMQGGTWLMGRNSNQCQQQSPCTLWSGPYWVVSHRRYRALPRSTPSPLRHIASCAHGDHT